MSWFSRRKEKKQAEAEAKAREQEIAETGLAEGNEAEPEAEAVEANVETTVEEIVETEMDSDIEEDETDEIEESADEEAEMEPATEETEDAETSVEDTAGDGESDAGDAADDSQSDGTDGEKKGFWSRLKAGLSKTRQNITSGIDSIFGGYSEIDDEFYEDIEEILVMGDIGVQTSGQIIEDLQRKVKERHIKQPQECRELLMESIKEQMAVTEADYEFENRPAVILVVGVNGVGKTTTIGKLASQMKAQNKRVILAAADTFRAAAGLQLGEWANRAGVEMIGGQEGADPAAVVYDAAQAAKSRKADVLIVDTAGRLHNKKNLMEELRKIGRVLERELPDMYRETLVVVDAATGQNALNQAKQFHEVTNVTGVVLTKMDGTAKGGIAIAIQSELQIPVKYIGVGEQINDLQKFDTESFVEALFQKESEEE